MANQQIEANIKVGMVSSNRPSALDQFTLGFEFNKTLREVRKDVKLRTLKVK